MKPFCCSVLLICLAAPALHAEPVAVIATPRMTPTIRTSIATVKFSSVGNHRPAAMLRSGRKNTTNQKVGAAFGMGVVGLLGGGFLGAKLEPDCYCDDPGLKGMMIGAPVGAALGAILGWRLAR